MKLWKLVIYGTIAWAFVSGFSLLARKDQDGASTVTWHRPFVAWMIILSALFMLIVRIVIEFTKQPKTNTLLIIELGFLCGSMSLRIPMAISQSLDDRVAWSQTISLSNYIVWGIITTLGVWRWVVIPGIIEERGAALANDDIGTAGD